MKKLLLVMLACLTGFASYSQDKPNILVIWGRRYRLGQRKCL